MGLNLTCKVCGDRRGVVYRPKKRQMLCDPCDRITPDKVSRVEFENEVWGDLKSQVPMLLRDEYYTAYLTSPFGLKTFQEMAHDHGRSTPTTPSTGEPTVRPGDGGGAPEGE
jgi:hypothetical protein